MSCALLTLAARKTHCKRSETRQEHNTEEEGGLTPSTTEMPSGSSGSAMSSTVRSLDGQRGRVTIHGMISTK
jgi:hypothetical protein